MYKTALLSIALSLQPATGFTQSIDQAPSQALIAKSQDSFHEYDSGTSIDYIVNTASGPGQTALLTQSFDPEHGGSLKSASTSYPNPHISRMVMDAGFVGTGTTIKRWSYPTAGNKFVMTIYLVHVISVAIGDGGSVKAGQDIYIVRAGGEIHYKGHPVVASDSNFDLFPIKTTYVFFGRKLASNLYKVDSNEALEDDDGLVHESNKRSAHASIYTGRSAASVLTEAFDAWQALPTPKTGGRNE